MPIFRTTGKPHDLAVSMAGIKMGDRVLQVGCRNPRMFATFGLQVGFSGHSCALVETKETADRAQNAATRIGALIEVDVGSFDELPYEDELFNLVILWDAISSIQPHPRGTCLREVRRVLVAGGRCLIIETAERGGLGALFSNRSIDNFYASSGGAEPSLRGEGFIAVRRLGEGEDLVFIEGTKPRS